MDRTTIDHALQTLNSALPEPATWIVLLQRNGELLGRTGEYMNVLRPPLTDELVASSTYAHAMEAMGMLESLRHGTLQYTISFGSSGLYFLFHLNDTYLLGVSYYRGVRSIEAVLEGVLANFYELLETINPFGG